MNGNNELLGQALGTCTLQRLIGRGGMGAVYLAQQSRPRRTVAVKVLMPSTFLDQRPRAEFLARFRREADAVAALDHINIMPIYEYGEQEDVAFLVMPYVTGGTLRQLLEKRSVLPLDDVLPIIDQAASALDSAHAQGIIHRDLKPGNILFHADGRVLLADFGLAKMVKDAQEFESHGQTALTSAGAIIGTPEYLSPEQGTGKPIDYRTDVYSLGVVLFQMLAGRVPFTGSSPVAVAIKHAMEEPPSLIQQNPAISPEVEKVVHKALSKNPDERFDSTGALARALHEAARPHAYAPVKLENTHALNNNQAVQQGQVPANGGAVMPTFNTAPTEANPPVTTSKENNKSEPATTAAEQSTQQPQQAFAEQQQPAKHPVQPVQLAQQQYQTAWPPEAAQPFVDRQPSRRKNKQSIMMTLLGGMLILAIIVGGLAAYVHFAHAPQKTAGNTPGQTTPGSNTQGHNGSSPTTTTCPTQNPGPKVTAGSLVYSEALPDINCGTQAGKWSVTAGTTVTRSGDTTMIDNSGSNNSAGMFLQSGSNGQAFDTSHNVIQVQAVEKSGTSGTFGIYFLAKSGSQPVTFAVLFDTNTKTWYTYYYSSGPQQGKTDPSSSIASGPIVNSTGNAITIDVINDGNNATYWVDGSYVGNSVGLGADQGTFGLAVGPHSKMAFKNVAVYAAH